MAMNTKKGFTLLIAMIFVGVVLAIAATLGALGYKQSILASNAIQSQYAFYAADSAMECALYADQKQSPSPVAYADYPTAPTVNSISCEGTNTALSTLCYNSSGCSSEWVSTARIPLDSGTHCADLTFYETTSRASVYIFAEGYNVACSAVGTSARVVARGLETQY